MNKKVTRASVTCRLLLLGLALSAAHWPSAVIAQDQPFTLGLDGTEQIREFSLPVGKSQIIQSRRPLSQVVVGNPGVADVELLNSSQFIVLGKAPGSTNLAFKDTQSNIVAVLDVVVGHDLDAIKRNLASVLPDETAIEIRSSNGKVMLSGQVGSAAALETVLAVTGSFAQPDQILNLLQVGGGQQVMLEARIAEVKRNRMRDLGVEMEFSDAIGSETGLDLVTGAPLRGAFGNLVLDNTGVGDRLLLNLQALEQQGAAQVLAEPNMVAQSGQEASFLVGGEFPVPVAQAGAAAGAITIQYKEFGVGLKFVPSVLSSKRINLRLTTEVSDIDVTSGTTVLGTTVPGLRTRRAATTIELGDGNSFAIAGLLQNDISTVIKEFPGLGRVPVIGALFRSTAFANEETELVIIVTPRLVRSVKEGSLEVPTDGFRAPGRWEQYGLGLPEAPAGSGSGNAAPAGGLDGNQGHQF